MDEWNRLGDVAGVLIFELLNERLEGMTYISIPLLSNEI